ncbi:ister chromatid cohesion protein [Pycnococcus provasolii]
MSKRNRKAHKVAAAAAPAALPDEAAATQTQTQTPPTQTPPPPTPQPPSPDNGDEDDDDMAQRQIKRARNIASRPPPPPPPPPPAQKTLHTLAGTILSKEQPKQHDAAVDAFIALALSQAHKAAADSSSSSDIDAETASSLIEHFTNDDSSNDNGVLSVLTLPNLPPQLYVDDQIKQIIQRVRENVEAVLADSSNPVVTKVVQAHALLARLQARIRLAGTLQAQIQRLAMRALEVPNPRANPLPFVSMQLASLELLWCAFDHGHHASRLDVVTSLAKILTDLPSTPTREIRTCAMPIGECDGTKTANVRPVSAALVLCMQASLSLPSQERSGEGDVSASSALHAKCTHFVDAFWIALLQNVSTARQREIDIKAIVESVVEDLCSLQSHGDMLWPACDVILHGLCTVLGGRFGFKSTEVLHRSLACDVVGKVVAHALAHAKATRTRLGDCDVHVIVVPRTGDGASMPPSDEAQDQQDGSIVRKSRWIPVEFAARQMGWFTPTSSGCHLDRRLANGHYWVRLVRCSSEKAGAYSESITDACAISPPLPIVSPLMQQQQTNPPQGYYAMLQLAATGSAAARLPPQRASPELEYPVNAALQAMALARRFTLTKLYCLEAEGGVKSSGDNATLPRYWRLQEPLEDVRVAAAAAAAGQASSDDSKTYSLAISILATTRRLVPLSSPVLLTWLTQAIDRRFESSPSVRCHAMKALHQLASADPESATNVQAFQDAVEHALSDESSSVRAAAVSSDNRSELTAKLAKRCRDTSLAVRKAALTTLRDVAHEDKSLDDAATTDALAVVLWRVDDPEESIRALVVRTFIDVLSLTPSSVDVDDAEDDDGGGGGGGNGLGSPTANLSAATKGERAARVLATISLNYFRASSSPSGAISLPLRRNTVLVALLQRILRDKGDECLHVHRDAALHMAVDGLSDGTGGSLLAPLLFLHALDVAGCPPPADTMQSLVPHIVLTKRDDSRSVAETKLVLLHVMGASLRPPISDVLYAEAEKRLVNLFTNAAQRQVAETASTALCGLAAAGDSRARACVGRLFAHYRAQLSVEAGDDDAARVPRALFALGALLRSGGGSVLRKPTTAAQMHVRFQKLYGSTASHPQQNQVASFALGALCDAAMAASRAAHAGSSMESAGGPPLLQRLDVHALFARALSQNSPLEDQDRVLRLLSELSAVEEDRLVHAQSKADAGCSNGAEKMTINKINGATDDVATHAGAAIQEHFTRVVELSGDASAHITVRSRATTVVAAALVHGHVPPQEALPSILRSATTDPDESLRRGAAAELHRFLANDGAGRVASSLADGIKLAARMLKGSSSTPPAYALVIWGELYASAFGTRLGFKRRFLESAIRHIAETTVQSWWLSALSADILATLPYVRQAEALHVVVACNAELAKLGVLTIDDDDGGGDNDGGTEAPLGSTPSTEKLASGVLLLRLKACLRARFRLTDERIASYKPTDFSGAAGSVGRGSGSPFDGAAAIINGMVDVHRALQGDGEGISLGELAKRLEQEDAGTDYAALAHAVKKAKKKVGMKRSRGAAVDEDDNEDDNDDDDDAVINDAEIKQKVSTFEGRRGVSTLKVKKARWRTV